MQVVETVSELTDNRHKIQRGCMQGKGSADIIDTVQQMHKKLRAIDRNLCFGFVYLETKHLTEIQET